jgi:hypothetical protein
MTIKYGLQIFFFELTDNDGQNFLAGIVRVLNPNKNVRKFAQKPRIETVEPERMRCL